MGEEIKLEDLKKEIAAITDAVKNFKEPNYDELYQKMEAIVDTKVADLKAPVKAKAIDQGPEIEDGKFIKGKFAGLKKSDIALTNMICKTFNVNRSSELEKAMTSVGAGVGDEWVNQDMQAALWDDWQERTLVADKFHFIDMPTDPFTLPIKTGDMTIYSQNTQNTAVTASDVGTGNLDMAAGKLMGQVDFSYELEEDAILAVIGVIRGSMADAMAAAQDYVILNADATTGTGNISHDSSSINANHRALVKWDGLRHAGLVDNTAMKSSVGTIGASDILTIGALQGKYFTRPGNNVLFTDIYTYFKMLGMAEVNTIEKYGAMATILRGELGRIYNIPIVITEQLPKTQANGTIHATPGSNSKGSFILTHRPSWIGGFKRRIMMEQDKDITTQTNKLVISTRMAFKGFGTMSAQTHTVVGYNVTV